MTGPTAPSGPSWTVRRLMRMALVPLAVVLMLLEDYVWHGLKALMARLGRLAVVARVEARIARLPPFWAATLFVVPGLAMIPFKLAALWAMGSGHVLAGVTVFVAAKLTGTALFARLYTLCEPTLMTVGWFVRIHSALSRARAWAHARLNAWPAWRWSRQAIRRLRGRLGALIRR